MKHLKHGISIYLYITQDHIWWFKEYNDIDKSLKYMELCENDLGNNEVYMSILVDAYVYI